MKENLNSVIFGSFLKTMTMVWLAGFLIFVVTFTTGQNGCDKKAKSDSPSARENSLQTTAALIKKLRAGGAKVESKGEKIEQPFFSPSGQNLNVNGETVQVFEYENSATADTEAAQIKPDGTTATTMINWVAPPHFFRNGNLIVLYVGENADVIKSLENALGRQFAGK